MTENTAFQQLITDDAQAQEILNDLSSLDDEDWKDVEAYEISLTFHKDDVPSLVRELEEMVHGKS